MNKRRSMLVLLFLPAFLAFSCNQKPPYSSGTYVRFPLSNEANRREFPFFAELYNAVAAASGGRKATINPSFPEEEEYDLPVPITKEDQVYYFNEFYEGDYEKWYRYACLDFYVYGGAFTTMTFEEDSPAPSSHFAGKTVDLLLVRVNEIFTLNITFFVIMTDGDSIFGFPAYNDWLQPPLEEWTAEEGCRLYNYGVLLDGISGNRLWEPFGPWTWYLEWGEDRVVNHGLGMLGTPKEGYLEEGYLETSLILEEARLVDDVISDGEKNPITYVTLKEPYHIERITNTTTWETRVEK